MKHHYEHLKRQGHALEVEYWGFHPGATLPPKTIRLRRALAVAGKQDKRSWDARSHIRDGLRDRLFCYCCDWIC
jgi:hypothetical protein